MSLGVLYLVEARGVNFDLISYLTFWFSLILKGYT